MSTSYFILSKSKTSTHVYDNTDNQIIDLNNNRLAFFLPKNIISYYCENGIFESELIDWSKQFCSKEKIFLDIGAHTGTYSLSLSQECKEVYSFEPQKMTYYALCGSVAMSNLQNITCLNIGLGSNNQVGKKWLNIVSDDGGGSTLHLTDNNKTNVLRKEEITVETLDNIADKYSISSDIGFVKMDVEDNEYYVLLGAENTLKNSNYPKILFECNNRGNNQPLFTYLSKLGYIVISVQGVANMYLASYM
jgi:FkbM family methyltransferase